MATAPSKSISGELIGLAGTERRLARNSARGRALKRMVSHSSMLKALTMRLPVIVSCRMFWISASLSWPRRVVVRTWRPILREPNRSRRNEDQQNPGQLAAVADDHDGGEDKVKSLLQKLGQHADIAILHALDVVDEAESSVPVACFWKKATERRSRLRKARCADR